MPETIAKLVIKKTATAAAVPPLDLLQWGELAVNFTDGKLFYRNGANVIEVIGIRNPASVSASQTFTGDNTFSGENTFSNNNTFSGDNEFSGNNEFTEANTFSGNNSFTGNNTFSGVTIFKAIGLSHLTLADGVISWNAEDGNLASVTLSEDSSLSIIENYSPGTYILRVIQDNVGGHSLTFSANFKTIDGEPIEIADAADSISIVTFLNNGDSDFYVMSQNNFLSSSDNNHDAELAIPNSILVVSDANEDVGGTYYRIYSAGLPEYNKINNTDDIIRYIIHPDIDGNYVIETQGRNSTSDPWNSQVAHYRVNPEFYGTTTPWLATWLNLNSGFNGNITTNEIIEDPAFVATFSAGPNVGQTIYFYQSPFAPLWYGTGPIPAGQIYRAINPNTAESSQYYYLAPRDNDVNAEWNIGVYTSNVLIELMYPDGVDDGSGHDGPTGAYSDMSQDPQTMNVTEYTPPFVLN